MVAFVNSVSIFDSSFKMIGKTPLVNIYKKGGVEVWIKLEGFNPSGSIKDVAAYSMIKDAEKKGMLSKGKIIIEATSGNTGIALAMISAMKGYNFTAIMPETASIERRKIIEAYGGKVILTPASEKSDGPIKLAKKLSKDKKYIWLNQYKNDYNWKGHYNITGKMIYRQTQGKITHFIAGIGTGGTIMGTGRRLKEYNKNIRIIGVEPVKNHSIQGLKNMSESIVPEIYNESFLDEKIMATDADAINGAKWIAKKHGLLVGLSSGAAITASLRYAKKLESGVIVTISPDSGFKYLSTGLFDKSN